MSSLPQCYLEAEILTAPPQKLQLMMIEAAIRFCRRAGGHWEAGEDERACEALIRVQQIVTELINGLNRDESPELTGKIAAVYLFVFRSLMEANYERDHDKLDDAIRVLEIERDTWRQVCERVGRVSDSQREAARGGPHAAASATAGVAFPDLSDGSDTPGVPTRFSLDA